MLSFGAGKHDDPAHALGLIGQLLDKMTAGRKPREERKPKRDAYAERSDDHRDSLATL